MTKKKLIKYETNKLHDYKNHVLSLMCIYLIIYYYKLNYKIYKQRRTKKLIIRH
jgi:hypothetical protein